LQRSSLFTDCRRFLPLDEIKKVQEEVRSKTKEKDMKKFLIVGCLLIAVATPVLAQPFSSQQFVMANGQIAKTKASSKAADSALHSYAEDLDASRSPPPGAYNGLGR
jgi:hypothetical protein